MKLLLLEIPLIIVTLLALFGGLAAIGRAFFWGGVWAIVCLGLGIYMLITMTPGIDPFLVFVLVVVGTCFVPTFGAFMASLTTPTLPLKEAPIYKATCATQHGVKEAKKMYDDLTPQQKRKVKAAAHLGLKNVAEYLRSKGKTHTAAAMDDMSKIL